MLKVAIFTEAGSGYGYGHLSRCTALKQGFEELGVCINMYVRGDATQKEYFQKREWLECFESIMDEGFDIIVIDSYHAKENIYQYAAKHSRLGVWFDDTKRIEYPSGLVLNAADGAILRKSFWSAKPHDQNLNRLFLSLGSLNERFCEFEQALSERYEIVSAIDVDENSLCDLMLSCKCALSACGQTMLELASLGIPTVGIMTADNQRKNADYCLANNHILGIADSPTAALALLEGGGNIIPLKASTMNVCKKIINTLKTV